MNIEQIINDEVYNTESGQKLIKILSKYDISTKAAELFIIMSKTETQRQCLLDFLKDGTGKKDTFVYHIKKINSLINEDTVNKQKFCYHLRRFSLIIMLNHLEELVKRKKNLVLVDNKKYGIRNIIEGD